MLYLVRFAATVVVTSVLIGAFTGLTFVAIALFTGEPLTANLARRWLETAGLLALAQLGYCGLFGLLGLLTRRLLLVLLIGVTYLALFEGLLSTLDTVARGLTVMYYFRVLVQRWLEPEDAKIWAIDLKTAPSAQTCVLVLVGMGVVLSTLAAIICASREFRMKTPEGN